MPRESKSDGRTVEQICRAIMAYGDSPTGNVASSVVDLTGEQPTVKGILSQAMAVAEDMFSHLRFMFVPSKYVPAALNFILCKKEQAVRRECAVPKKLESRVIFRCAVPLPESAEGKSEEEIFRGMESCGITPGNLFTVVLIALCEEDDTPKPPYSPEFWEAMAKLPEQGEGTIEGWTINWSADSPMEINIKPT